MQKHINLIIKDIITYKKILFFPFYFQLALFFTPNSPVISLLFPILLGLYCFLVMYVTEEEKNNGTELLTTIYNRSDIVISRYILCFIILLFQVLNFNLILFIKSKELVRLSTYQICFSSIIIVLFIALFIPITFYFKAKLLPIFVTIISIIMSPLIVLFETSKNIILMANNILLLCIITFTLSFLLLSISIFLANKIYLNQDL